MMGAPLGRLRAWLRSPGSYRIAFGGAVVAALVAMAALGDRISPYPAGEMDLDHILQPPAAAWLRRLCLTERGAAALALNRPEARAAAPSAADEGEEGEEGEKGGLDYLNSGEARPAAPAPAPAHGPRHWLGTDKEGRDMAALLVAGARSCVFPGLLAAALALGLGVPLGLLAGYYGGWAERLTRGANAVVLSMPRLVLILVVICALEPNLYYTMAVLGASLVPRVSGVLATRVRALSRQGFILAAREAGLDDFTILRRHLFWYQNRAVFFIQFSLIMAESVLVETTLSYLQFGAKPPQVSWGSVIEGSQQTFFSGVYWITFLPAAAIVLAILGFFYLGDGMNAGLAHREGR